MNKAVEKIIQENKRAFLIRNNLFEKEYATYTLSGIGVTDDNQEIPFSFKTNKPYTRGDKLTLKRQDGSIVQTRIREYRYIYDDTDTAEYPHTENGLKYKEVPLNITDEEYELLKKELSGTRDNIQTSTNKNSSDSPTTVVALYGIAGVLFLASIFLFVKGADPYDGAPIYIISSILSIVQGVLFIAIGKIVNYLSIIANK